MTHHTLDMPISEAQVRALKVGDTVSAVVREALAVSIEPAPKGLFNWL